MLRRQDATGGVQWRGPGFTAATSVDLAAGRCQSWTVAPPSTCLGPAMGRCCLWGTAGWDRPGALWRHWGRPVAQPRFPGDRPTRFGSSRFWAVSAGGSMSSRARWFCTTGGCGRATPTQYLPPAGPAGRPGISRHQSRTLADTHHNSLTQFPSARGHQSHTQSRHAQSPHRIERLPVARAAVGHGRLAASNTPPVPWPSRPAVPRGSLCRVVLGRRRLRRAHPQTRAERVEGGARQCLC